MAKKAKKSKTRTGIALEIVNPHAAGIDVSSTEMQVCVPEDRDSDNNRRFGTFTEDLHTISSWLKAFGYHHSSDGIDRRLLGSVVHDTGRRRV